MMMARTLMVLGSMSSAGKSVLVTGLCRLYARRGVRVLPFKAQNMSNNAAVCSGGEIGRAQAVQAHAATVEPTVDMNPVLLKPEGDRGSQVIIRGRVWDTVTAADYYARRARLWSAVTESLTALRRDADLVVIEGAGSPAEMNLRGNDIVNMAVARFAQAPCLLAGDIDRGGVFAQLLGTLWLLEGEDRGLVRGFVVNKFRGDRRLFDDGVRILEGRGGVPVLGVVPFIPDLGIAEEDAAGIGDAADDGPAAVDVAVVSLPHISNFDDLDPLRLEPGVRLRYVRHAGDLGRPAAVILPGSKSTLADLEWLRSRGFAEPITRAAREGTAVVGLCGGFQILGKEVVDAHGVEGGGGRAAGLGLLPVRTRLEERKTVSRSRAKILADQGFWGRLTGSVIEGYEIHMGASAGGAPLCAVTEREGAAVSAPDGACDASGRVFGTYLHGLFENDALRGEWLRDLGVAPAPWRFADQRLKAYDRLADIMEKSLDMPALDRIVEGGVR